MTDGSRSRTGCLTCRIRKKKCDEQRPICKSCQSRQLACYGFNEPAPAWFTSKPSWKDVRDSEEAKSLQTLAETRYKIRRKLRPEDENSSSASTASQVSSGNEHVSDNLIFESDPLFNSIRLQQHSAPIVSGMNVWQLRPESLWWDSKIRSLAPSSDTSSREDTRLLMLFLDVIHPISHTFYKLDANRDRNWMLNRLLSEKALHSSALSISACFDHSLAQPPKLNNIGICPKVRTLQSKAIHELRLEVEKFGLMDRGQLESLVLKGAQLLAVINHLKTLEIFSMLQGCWELHHSAARRILDHIESSHPTQVNAGPRPRKSVIEQALTDWSLEDDKRRSLEFAITTFIWVDILAISTFGMMSFSPFSFDYRGLLESEVIKPQQIMGCQGRIMAVVVEIARLEQWLQIHGSKTGEPDVKAELARRGQLLTQHLVFGLKRLETAAEDSNKVAVEEDIRLVSIIWAYGALVLLQVVLHDAEPVQPMLDQTFVDSCLQKLEELPTRIFMRTSWPYTISGCMSSSESQHSRFRRLFHRTMEDAQPPGISWKGLIVMEECWRLRQLQSGGKVGWREAMQSLGARVILT